jgi:hypothetical protein
VAWEQEACETDNPCSKNEVGLLVPAVVAGRTVLVETSEEMVACDMRLTMVGESMGRERGTMLPDLDRPYRSYQSSEDPPSNDPPLHADPGLSAGDPESLLVRWENPLKSSRVGRAGGSPSSRLALAGVGRPSMESFGRPLTSLESGRMFGRDVVDVASASSACRLAAHSAHASRSDPRPPS